MALINISDISNYLKWKFHGNYLTCNCTVSFKKCFYTERNVQQNLYNLRVNVNGKPITLISYTYRRYRQCLDNKKEYG